MRKSKVRLTNYCARENR